MSTNKQKIVVLSLLALVCGVSIWALWTYIGLASYPVMILMGLSGLTALIGLYIEVLTLKQEETNTINEETKLIIN